MWPSFSAQEDREEQGQFGQKGRSPARDWESTIVPAMTMPAKPTSARLPPLDTELKLSRMAMGASISMNPA